MQMIFGRIGFGVFAAASVIGARASADDAKPAVGELAPPPEQLMVAAVDESTAAESRLARQPVPGDYPAASAGSAGTLHGQLTGFLAYNFSIPVGSVRDFTTNVSPLGLELQLREWVLPSLSIGASAEWSNFVDDRPPTTYTVQNGALTAAAFNHVSTWNVRLLVHYYFNERGQFLPYVGPHLGVGWSAFDSEVADLQFSDTEFSFAYGLDAGAVFRFGTSQFALANVRYAAQPGSEFLGFVDNVQTVSVQVGIGL
jgi:opacity protein-like surface antigen